MSLGWGSTRHLNIMIPPLLGSFCELGVLFVIVPTMRALLFRGLYQAPDFWKLPYSGPYSHKVSNHFPLRIDTSPTPIPGELIRLTVFSTRGFGVLIIT